MEPDTAVQALETDEHSPLVIYFGVTFNSMDDAERVLPAHDEFVKSQQELAASRGLLHPYMYVLIPSLFPSTPGLG